MKLYKSPNNEVFAYEEDGSQDHLIPGEYIAITEEEAEQINKAKEQERYAKKTYADYRRMAYPSIGDQLDALYHAGVFPAEMAAMIAEVKAKFPKD